jgi:penicillin amidase
LRLLCAGLVHRPRHYGIGARLAALPRRDLPLDRAVEIHWNERLVPYLEAESDRDLAVGLGVVHAHLRLAQMEFLRRIAEGRIAEVLGPVAAEVDHALRLLDLGRAVPAMLSALPEPTRLWLDGFVAGVNHHLGAAPPPLEFRLLGIRAEPWTVADVLRLGRLVAADVNWLVWLRLLRLPRGPDETKIWTRLVAGGTSPAAGVDEPLAHILLGIARSASNAVAVAGCRSATGAAWLAGDPHLSLGLPSVWLAAAYRSPSYNLAGLMIPGIPAMAIGRNPWIAWGGTNLHAASSELFDVSGLSAAAIRERSERIGVRWSRPRDIVVRDTDHGPIVSDAPLLARLCDRPVALRWIGHEASDEISTLLALNRARDWDGFRRAAAGLAIPGQTFVYADRDGHVGRLAAALLPRRQSARPAGVISPIACAEAWNERVGAAELPALFDPPQGFVVSANESPPPSPVAIGWFFSPPDRALRLAELLDHADPVGAEDLRHLLQDVLSRTALALRNRFFAGLPEAPLATALAQWDGNYEVQSAGALAFELVWRRLVEEAIPPARRNAYAAVWNTRRLLAQELAGLVPEVLARHRAAAVAAATADFARWRRWGAVHHLRLFHPFAALPGILRHRGRRWRFGDWPAAGGNDTLFKTSHGLVDGPHAVGYGSNARYIFDLSDPNANDLIILGGQDGTPGSAAFLDQAALFRAGRTIRVPLTAAAAQARFPYKTRLEPAP